ncbi:MAG TPA: retropepsin-like aspartic protease, partial [Steroidobacteraceae bacterium]|nr:retropepsin-like aspartic protease [Steroidobacteraceae bacterium]
MLALLALLTFFVSRGVPAEPCSLHRFAELPVTMAGMSPTVHAKINGDDSLFIADSGAFFSVLTPAGAEQLHLSLQDSPVKTSGVGGNSRTWMTTVKTFTIFNTDFPKVVFLVAGNDFGYGIVGVLGQNVFRLG